MYKFRLSWHHVEYNEPDEPFTMTLKSLIILAFLTFVHKVTAAQSIQDIGQLFSSAQIVPDVIPAFNPSVLLDVTFRNKSVVAGETLPKNGTYPYSPIPSRPMSLKLFSHCSYPDVFHSGNNECYEIRDIHGVSLSRSSECFS